MIKIVTVIFPLIHCLIFFSDLNKDENNENDADVFEANINMQQPNDALNNPITKDEIEKATKNLKNNKASFEDLIINEYLQVHIRRNRL